MHKRKMNGVGGGSCITLLGYGILYIAFQCISGLPHTTEQIVFVEEFVRLNGAHAGENNATATLITLTETSSSSSSSEEQMNVHMEVDTPNESSADDLIFAVKKPQKQMAAKRVQLNVDEPHRQRHQVDLLASPEKDSLTATSTHVGGMPREILYRHAGDEDNSSSNSDSNSEADNADPDADVDADDDDVVHATKSAFHNRPLTLGSGLSKPIDMSDFLTLIPVNEVKAIAANYNRNDPEVQRACRFLRSQEFTEIRQNIMQLPEMTALLRYFNDSGLNVLAFFQTITNRTFSQPAQPNTGNDVIIDAQDEPIATTAATTATATTTTTTLDPHETTTIKEQLNGLHGLIDSILDVLPQDQILATFFDKLETDEQFAHVVDSISNPKFAKILNNLQNSMALRNLILVLQQHGIYITRIVDSLKSYFFLGTL